MGKAVGLVDHSQSEHVCACASLCRSVCCVSSVHLLCVLCVCDLCLCVFCVLCAVCENRCVMFDVLVMYPSTCCW